jgi:S1-C subfamily serine protease
MKKDIVRIIVILIIGAIGGSLFQILILPSLIAHPYFGDLKIIKRLKNQVIVNPVEEIMIGQDTALEEAIKKVENTTVGFQNGSGIIITSDGLVATLADALPKTEKYLFLEGEKVNFEIVREDLEKNLVLIEIDQKNTLACKFADLSDIKMGQKVFLLGVVIENEIPKSITNQGSIKMFDDEIIYTNILEDEILNGSPLFNVWGEVLGLNIIDENGKVSAISIDEVRKFAGF